MSNEILKIPPLFCVDAGAAGGLVDLPNLKPIINLYSIEPQEKSYKELAAVKNLYKSHKIFPVGLHSYTGKAVLNIANRPSMSSLLKFDEIAFDKHFGFCEASAKWKHALTQTASAEIEVVTLNKFCAENDITNIDLLKLDTQGTELEILKGASDLIQQNKITVIKTEFSTLPVYHQQCTLIELDTYLKDKGLVPVNYTVYPDTVNQSGIAAINSIKQINEIPPIGAGGDAVYVLKDELLDKDKALRAGVILCSMGFISYGSHLLVNLAGIEKVRATELIKMLKPGKSFRKKVKELIPPVIMKYIN